MLPLIVLSMAAVAAEPAPFDAPMSDDDLAQERGGFRLPNGIDVNLAVQTQTAVDGRVVLATVFTLGDIRPTFAAYVPSQGEKVSAQPAIATDDAATTSTMPRIIVDGRNTISIVPGESGSTGVSVNGQAENTAVPDGLVEASPGRIGDYTLTATNSGLLRRVELNGSDISITHFAGSAFGSAIANTGSDRTIDTVTTISIDLRNAGPENVGSTFLQIGDLAADAIARRIN